MAAKAGIIVRNLLPHDIDVARNISRERRYLETKINRRKKDKFHLPGPDVSLRIKVPNQKDAQDCPIKVKSDVDFSLLYSRSHSCWTLKLEPNDSPPNVPTTVTVDVGEEGP